MSEKRFNNDNNDDDEDKYSTQLYSFDLRSYLRKWHIMKGRWNL